jgi:hypothetical protein
MNPAPERRGLKPPAGTTGRPLKRSRLPVFVMAATIFVIIKPSVILSDALHRHLNRL